MNNSLAVFLLVIAFAANSCQRNAEPETYLIPAPYSGKVRILFRQNGSPHRFLNENGNDTTYWPKMGTPKLYEKGRRVYHIPAHGVLLTQFQENDGHIDKQYYLVDSAGMRTALKVFEFEHYKRDSAGYVVLDPNEKGVFGDVTSGSYGNMNVPYQTFTICTYNELDSFSTKKYSREFDEKLEILLGITLNLK